MTDHSLDNDDDNPRAGRTLLARWSVSQRRALLTWVRAVAALVVVAVSALVIVAPSSPISAGTIGSPTKTLTSADPTTPGQLVTYEIEFSCSSLTSPCGATSIVDTLDPSLEFVSSVTPPGWSESVTGQEVTLSTPNLAAGTAVRVTLSALVRLGTAPGDIPNTATISISNPDPGTPASRPTNEVVVTVEAVDPNYGVSKSLLSGEPIEGGQATYRAEFCSESPRNDGLTGVTLVDSFPVGAVVVAADGGDTSTPGEITWAIPDVDLVTLYAPPAFGRQCFAEFTYTLEFPAGTFPEGTPITNAINGTGTGEFSGIGVDESADVTVTVQPERTALAVGKAAVSAPVAGGDVVYTIDASTSDATVDTPDVRIVETVPLVGGVPLQITRLELIDIDDIADEHRVEVEVSTDSGATYTSVATLEDGDLAPALALGGATDIRLSVFYLDTGGAAVDAVRPAVDLELEFTFALPSDLSGDLTNCVLGSSGDGIVSDACTTDTVVQPAPDLFETGKRVASAPALVAPIVPLVPGDEAFVRIRLRVRGSGPLVNPIVTDLLPVGVEYVAFEPTESVFQSMSPAVQPTIDVIDDWNGTGQQLVRMSWGTPGDGDTTNDVIVNPNGNDLFFFRVGVLPAVEAGTYVNEMTVTHDGPTVDCPNPVADDNRDGNDQDDTVCFMTADIDVVSGAVVDAQKYDRGNPALPVLVESTRVPDATCPDFEGYTRFPCVPQTSGGETFDYLVRLQNIGNEDLSDLVVYDILPYVGDTGISDTLATSARGTEWQPTLTGPVVPSDAATQALLDAGGVTIEYSDSTNPCRPEMIEGPETGMPWPVGCVDDWTTTPDTFDDVRAYRIVIPFDTDVWEPLDEVRFDVVMLAPVDAPPGDVAWNSIAFRATGEVTGRLLAAEPEKVGIIIGEVYDLALVKVAPVLDVEADDVVEWQLRVQNQGNVTAGEFVVTDTIPSGMAFESADNGGTEAGGVVTWTISDLAPGEFIDLSLTTTITDAGLAPFRNWAEISSDSGSDIDSTPDVDTGSDDTLPTDDYVPISDLADAAIEVDGDEDDNDDAIVTVVSASVSVGDFVFIDENRDGLQDGGDTPVEDATLTLTGPNGGAVTDVFGNLVTPTQTDGSGLYSFDDLPVLAAGQSYTVTVDPSTAPTLTGFVPTNPEADPVTGSSTGSATSGDLTNDGDRDPTLDFGFVSPSVSVGDYVWFDTDRDGIQDSDESGIENVTLTLTGPNGGAVTDVFGNLVAPTQTDVDGLYSFDDLPALAAGESYTVTVTNPAGATPTTADVDAVTGSSTGSATSGDLTNDGDRDPTLDFGFVSIDLTLTKTLMSTETVRPGDSLTFEIVPFNDGPVDALAGWSVTELLPDGLTLVSMSGNGYVCSDDTCVATAGLAAGTSGPAITVVTTVDPDVTTSLRNVAYISPSPDDIAEDVPLDIPEIGADTASSPTNNDSQAQFVVTAASVSVGDLVWVDANQNGLQDASEIGLVDVTLTLTGPDGGPVTDINGNLVGPTSTDSNGTYSFDDLPVLAPGQSYTVTVTPPPGFEPTIAEVDAANGSSTGSASSNGLTVDGQRDPTLDFGFLIPSRIPVTGSEPIDTLRVGLMLLTAGLLLVATTRRRRKLD